ncbi:MAG: class I SAM-dependent methyltransferase [Bacteroidales bacterium]|nr:MAG: class I SAM-dependent methyltransferase [Bacteroidales bacterium]
METIKKSSCVINRPGGFIITDTAFCFCSFPNNAKILDLGCGSGATVDYLQQKYSFEAYGLDKKLELSVLQVNLIKAPAESIPFPATSMDGVLMECSFSMMDNQKTVLKECNRVLNANGRLIISDMYARGEAARLKGCLGRIDSKESIINIIESNGFTIEHFEDFTQHLQTMWGQMIFEKGAKTFYCDLGVDPETMKRIKCGYYLIVARKKDKL